jgi:protein TonB
MKPPQECGTSCHTKRACQAKADFLQSFHYENVSQNLGTGVIDMWEKTLIESKGATKKRRWWMFPLSLFIHALVIGVIVGASYWMVEAVQAPPIPVTLYSAPPPPPPPPPAAAKPKAAPETPKPKPVEKVETPKEVQPTQIPEETTPVEDFTPSEPDPGAFDESATDTGAGEPGGVEGGVEGGVVGGVPGGVIGGVPGGVVGGTPNGMGEEVPMRITAEVRQPKLVKKVEPPYPEVARRAKIEGVVILEAVITKNGTVEEVKVLRALHPVMDQAAMNAVKQWKYEPAVLNGRPVKVYFTVTVTFRLA